jgi:hypothetical protein
MQIFMERHVFAVWDFMTLLKSLQHNISCPSIVWTPPSNSHATNFIQSIVIGEECDKINDSLCLSHFELYIKAMKEIGANTKQIDKFITGARRVSNSSTYDRKKQYSGIMESLDEVMVPLYLKKFVSQTLQRSLLVPKSDVHKIASYFYYGREDPIPVMFTNFLNGIKSDDVNYQCLKMYLQRHIDVDGSDHGPNALKLLDYLTNESSKKKDEVLSEGIVAIRERHKLWNGIYKEIKA